MPAESPDPYATMTNDDEYAYIVEILGRTSPSSLLAEPGVLEILREEWNNEVLDCWRRDHPELFLDEEANGEEVGKPMRILIHENAGTNYRHRCYQHARASSGMLHNPEWVETLNAVSGQWLEVETEHLFADQFNTAPVPGVSEHGLRVMIEDVAAIEGDVREGVIKCNWCYGYDTDKDGRCDKCSKTEHLAPLNPKRPAPRGEA